MFPEFIKDSTSFNLLIVLSSVTLDLISLRDSLNFCCSFLRSKFTKISLTASAPIPAVKASSPNSSCALSKPSSDINWPFSKALKPGTTLNQNDFNELTLKDLWKISLQKQDINNNLEKLKNQLDADREHCQKLIPQYHKL